MVESDIQNIFNVIQSKYGLYINFAHENYMSSLITKRAEELGLSIDDYCSYVKKYDEELTFLADEAAINETYFFREEKQFDFLKNTFFPLHQNANIWCTSCSSGEEPLSVLALSESCCSGAKVYASDIDTKALKFFADGLYSKSSFRSDGQKFHHLLKQNCSEVIDPELNIVNFKVDEDFKRKISVFRHNLVSKDNTDLPFYVNTLDLIIIRNVFIYFDEKDRNFILQKLSDYLKPDGIIMFAMSEIASVSGDAVPDLIKENNDSVYYFRKMHPGEEKKQKVNPLTVFQQIKDSVQQKTDLYKNSLEKFTKTADYENKSEEAFLKKESAQTEKKEAVKAEEVLNNSSLEDSAKEIISLLEKHEVEKCKNLLSTLVFKAQNIEYKYYLTGLIAKEESDFSGAEDCFVKAKFSKAQFWPAKFQLGLLYYEQKKTAEMKNAFSDCVKDLMEYTQNNCKTYAFLFEDFDSSYFLELCYSYLYKK